MSTNLTAALSALQNKTINPTVNTFEPAPIVTPISQWQAAQAAQNARNIPIRQNFDQLRESIKRERLAKGWTQRDLARESGMSQGTITRAEKHGWVSLWCLLKITNALGKSLTI